jgi:hypothetical protein
MSSQPKGEGCCNDLARSHLVDPYAAVLLPVRNNLSLDSCTRLHPRSQVGMCWLLLHASLRYLVQMQDIHGRLSPGLPFAEGQDTMMLWDTYSQ